MPYIWNVIRTEKGEYIKSFFTKDALIHHLCKNAGIVYHREPGGS